MATNIVLTFVNTSGGSSRGAATLTLYANEDAAVNASKNTVFESVSLGRGSPSEQVEYPGFSGMRSKFMHAKARQYIIDGYVFDPDGSEATIKTAIEAVLDLNDTEGYYQISGSALIGHKGEGVVVNDVEVLPVGKGTGPEWAFRIHLHDLGV